MRFLILAMAISALSLGCYEGPTFVVDDKSAATSSDAGAFDAAECTECESGETRCTDAGAVETCIAEECPRWVVSETCRGSQTCSDGACVCDAPCDPETEQYNCQAEPVTVCMLVDGCPQWVAGECLDSQCGDGCEDGRACVDHCSEEETSCFRCGSPPG